MIRLQYVEAIEAFPEKLETSLEIRKYFKYFRAVYNGCDGEVCDKGCCRDSTGMAIDEMIKHIGSNGHSKETVGFCIPVLDMRVYRIAQRVAEEVEGAIARRNHNRLTESK